MASVKQLRLFCLCALTPCWLLTSMEVLLELSVVIGRLLFMVAIELPSEDIVLGVNSSGKLVTGSERVRGGEREGRRRGKKEREKKERGKKGREMATIRLG